MFKAKKLNKLVAAGIITQTQKQQILEYDDNADSRALVSRALMLLGIFTVGLGIISLVASTWQDIGKAGNNVGIACGYRRSGLALAESGKACSS